jgi:hypothetical protein
VRRLGHTRVRLEVQEGKTSLHCACEHVTILENKDSVGLSRSKYWPGHTEYVLIELLKHARPALQGEIMNYREKIFEAQEKGREEKRKSEERERSYAAWEEQKAQAERDKKNPFNSAFWSDDP